MSPEKLAEIRNQPIAIIHPIPELLTHIDYQAARIKGLEDHNDLLQNELFELRKGKDAQEAISDLMAQIYALKEWLVEERAANIWAMWELMHYNSDECAVPSEFIDTLENFNGCTECELESCAAKSWFVAEACQQLKAEMKWIEWE